MALRPFMNVMKLSIKSKGDNILYLISKKSNMTVVGS